MINNPSDTLSITVRLDFDTMTALLYLDWTNAGHFDSPSWNNVNLATLQGIRGVVNFVAVPCIENNGETEAGTGMFEYTAGTNTIAWTHTGGSFNIPGSQWHRGVMMFPFEFV